MQKKLTSEASFDERVLASATFWDKVLGLLIEYNLLASHVVRGRWFFLSQHTGCWTICFFWSFCGRWCQSKRSKCKLTFALDLGTANLQSVDFLLHRFITDLPTHFELLPLGLHINVRLLATYAGFLQVNMLQICRRKCVRDHPRVPHPPVDTP